MSLLVFEPDLRGHRLEYMHHLYEGYCKAGNLDDICFVVGNEFNPKQGGLIWESIDLARIVILSAEETALFQLGATSHLRKKKRIVDAYIRQENASSLFLISLMYFMPLIVLLGVKARVSGVIYNIHTRTEEGIIYKLRGLLTFLALRLRPCVKSLFLLNDLRSADWFNRIFITKKFQFLPDPFIPIKVRDVENIKDFKGITLLHFGGLTQRKGTLEVLKLAEKLFKTQPGKYRIILAGSVYPDIKKEVYAGFDQLKDIGAIKLFDEFCSYAQLGYFCSISDFILAPYQNVGQSSGMLGFAAQFGKPVVAPSEGLLGELVKKNSLGYTLEGINADKMQIFLNDYEKGSKAYYVKNDYLDISSPDSFYKQVRDYVTAAKGRGE
ncbi:MAG: hypothetical protein ACSHW7_15550 [Patiriisocius sp.]|uniref:hypothetical protein n=1 Tax=Patiriisocius sp. TaxID=2822396 RepID=UPI003EF75AA2